MHKKIHHTCKKHGYKKKLQTLIINESFIFKNIKTSYI